MSKVYTTNSGAKVLGVKQDTMKHYAHRFDVGSQPGGPGTPWLFTKDDLLTIRERVGELSDGCSIRRYEHIEAAEDREELGLGALYNDDASPRR